MYSLLRLLTIYASASGATPIANEPVALELRLKTPLTSFGSRAGDPFVAVLTSPAEVDGGLPIPAGTMVHGVVKRARRIGLGLIRERATLEIEFRAYSSTEGRRVPLRGRLVHVDNARETVRPDGSIRGILAAGHPRSFLQGLWLQPKPALLHRSAMGLTGASGRLWTQFSLGPFGAVGLFAARLAVFRMADPEISLPSGTDMTALLSGLSPRRPTAATAPAEAELEAWAGAQPFTLQKPNGQAADDIVNLFLIGSEQQLRASFAAAGWAMADAIDRQSFTRAYHAYNSHSGYPSAPVSKLLLEGVEPALVFQKSMNTISRRHHVRIWRRESNGRTIWMGAATHDVGIAFDAKGLSFTHKIDPYIDRERWKIGNDLAFAGCVSEAHDVDRPAAVQTQAKRNAIVTDGRAILVGLKDCAPVIEPLQLQPPLRPKLRVARSVRRVLLETRHYLVRGNAYYWAWRGMTYRRSRLTSVAVVGPYASGRNHPDLLPGRDSYALAQDCVP